MPSLSLYGRMTPSSCMKRGGRRDMTSCEVSATLKKHGKATKMGVVEDLIHSGGAHTTRGFSAFVTQNKDTQHDWHNSCLRTQTKMIIPLDSLEGIVDHVDDASSRSSDCTNQTFANAFEEACCALFLGSCAIIHVYKVVWTFLLPL